MSTEVDKIVTGWPSPGGFVVLTAFGRMFFRELDGRANLNTGPGHQPKYKWTEVEGPVG